MTESIAANTTIGAATLTISNLERSLAFYQNALGFQVQKRETETAHLGAGGPDLLILNQRPEARRVRGTTGLYHFAILVPSRLELARSLHHLVATHTRMQGAADHLVSEALYLADPDGNGIEIYRDRPRSAWKHDGDQVRMATDPLDAQGILAELTNPDEPWTGLHEQTVMGHMHLHVSQIAEAKAFYVDVLGFDIVARGPDVLFISAGGYHHHIGLNTWVGVGAPPSPAGSIGLKHFVIRLPNTAELERVAQRIRNAGIPLKETPEGIVVQDPSQNTIQLTATA